MSRMMRSHELHIPKWLGASELRTHAEQLTQYILGCGYSKGTLRMYRNAAAHFAHWMTVHRVPLSKVDEVLVRLGAFCRSTCPSAAVVLCVSDPLILCERL